MINIKRNLDDYLPFIQYDYNNGSYSSIQMAYFKAFFGQKSKSPMNWFEVGESILIGIGFVHD